MTIETYNKATKLLEEKRLLETELLRLSEKMRITFSNIDDYNEYQKACEKLFILGQEFAAL